MTTENLKKADYTAFINYCIDHVKNFNAIPCEFETKNGIVLNADDCWNIANKLHITKLIKKG